jgi:hypothetical protein
MNNGLKPVATSWPRNVLSILLILVLSMSIACFEQCCPEQPPQQLPPSATEANHILHINKVGEKYEVTDEGGNTSRRVDRGDWVQWKNHTGSDVELEFGPSKRLFGVLKAVSYSSGTPLKLQVRNDAVIDKHIYLPSGPTTVPPPDLVVNPPN